MSALYTLARYAEAMETDTSSLSRREFLGLASSGLFVFFCGATRVFQETPPQGEPEGYPDDFNAYLRIAPDGRVTCLVGKIEMGEGVMTSLPMLLADELDVPLSFVEIVMGDTDLCPWDVGTFGSLSTREFGPILQKAGAEARSVLLQMAAEHLPAPVDRLSVKDGVITDSSTGKHVSYGELVQGKHIDRHLIKDKVVVKPASALKIWGQSPLRRDGLDKITGRGKFAADFVLPGMLHARLVRPPAHGATLKVVDTSGAEKIEGARVIRHGDFIAVLHKQRDIADKAKSLIKADYDCPPVTVDDRSIFDHLAKHAPQPHVVDQSGNLEEGVKLSKTIVEETYLNSYVAHAPIEPHAATAAMENGRVTIWAGTQTPFPLKREVAEALQFPPDKVHIIVPYVGGGFGGKSASQQAIEAARLARITGRPVQVLWDRGEEFFFDTFRPAAIVKIRAGIDATGKLMLWDYGVIGAGDREAKSFYDAPHQRTTSSGEWSDDNPGLHPFAVGPWRAPSVNTNTFARESHINTVAGKAGIDPVDFRLKNLSHKRMRNVLQIAADRFGWQALQKEYGHGFGVSCGTDTGTYVAMMAEVVVDPRSGTVEVKRVLCVQDQGATVNPDGTRQQIEGGVMMGLGYALSEEVHFRGREILDRNFGSYQIPHFSWMPKIESVLVNNPALPPSGCGEPPIINVGAVLANAIFDAVGARVLQLPMTPSRVKAALPRT